MFIRNEAVWLNKKMTDQSRNKIIWLYINDMHKKRVSSINQRKNSNNERDEGNKIKKNFQYRHDVVSLRII
jgi:hypothetical protein